MNKDMFEEKIIKEVENSFFLLGIGTLLSWNTILTQLDFFMHYNSEYHPENVFGNINFAINLTLQFILLVTKRMFSYKTQIVFGLSCYIFSLIILPIATIYFNLIGQNYIGFVTCCVAVFINGFGNAVTQSSVFGLVSFFPMENTVAVGTGQGISGIILNVIRYFILFSMGEGKKDAAAGIFFGISIFTLVIVLRKVFVLYKNPYFISIMRKIGEIQGEEGLVEQERDIELQDLGKNEELQENSNKNKTEENGLIYLLKKIYSILLMVILCFTITIGLYPGACLKPDFFKFEGGWKVNSIILIFNLGDTIGRKLVGFLVNPMKWHLFSISLFRLTFLFFIPYLSYMNKTRMLDSNAISILSVIAIALMSSSSGIANTLCFSLAPKQVEGNLKSKAGACVSFCLSVGLFIGSLLANIISMVDEFFKN